ncbi:MAG: hypothetical protein K0S93_1143 [Nitrososphaeraceae archaeon]|nr:hypothetical protein [Nitrososphaeraceae archaeon]
MFSSTFFILLSLTIDYHSISSSDIKGNSSILKFQQEEITNSYHEKEDVPPMFIQSDSSSNGPEVVKVSSNSINVLENLIYKIINIQTTHNSGDTIKRSLIAQVNNAILILKDDDSDNDNIICNNFVNKFVSSVKLYERIGLFKPNSSSKISQDILTLKNSLCDSNR